MCSLKQNWANSSLLQVFKMSLSCIWTWVGLTLIGFRLELIFASWSKNVAQSSRVFKSDRKNKNLLILPRLSLL